MKHRVNGFSMNEKQRYTINVNSHTFAIEIDFHFHFHRFENQELKSIPLLQASFQR